MQFYLFMVELLFLQKEREFLYVPSGVVEAIDYTISFWVIIS